MLKMPARRRNVHARLIRASKGARPRGRLEGVSDAISAPFTYHSLLGEVAGDRRRPLTFHLRDAEAIEAELYSHLTPVQRRIWLQRSLYVLVRAVLLVACVELLAAILRFSAVPLPQAVVNAAAGIVGVLALLVIARQRVSFHDAARVLDRRLGLQQVVGTAVELLGSGADNRLARLQVRRATEVARVADHSAIGLRLPMRELQVVAALAVATVAFTYLSTLNIAWPGTPPAEEVSIDPAELDVASDVPYVQSTFDSSESPGANLDSDLMNEQLSDLRNELDGSDMSPEEIAARLAEVQAQLAQRADAIRRQTQALADLADTLSDSSATSDVAESIRRGDYDKAASQLSDLGKQSAQLSQRARQDLAQRLNQGANKVAANNPDLAEKMRQAAQALNSQDQQSAEQSLDQLGQGVNQAGEDLKQLADATAPMDPAELGPGHNDQSADGSDPSGQTPGDLAADTSLMPGMSPHDEGPNGEGDQPGGMGEGDPFATADLPDGSALGSSASGTSGQGEDQANGNGAGSGPGRETYQKPGAQNQAQSKVLELRGKPSASGASSVAQDDNVPLVSSNDGSVASGGSAGAGRSVIVDPLSVRAEQNFVPWEKRPIVRDYFNGSGTGK